MNWTGIWESQVSRKDFAYITDLAPAERKEEK